MKKELETKLNQLVRETSQRAKEIYEKASREGLQLSLVKAAGMSTDYPGIPFLDIKEWTIGEYIAIAVDMRNSSRHLCELRKIGECEKLERLFYETSILLPVLIECISYEKGEVVELLGDGVLGFFYCPDKDPNACCASYNAAHNCIEAVQKIINPFLRDEFGIPPIAIGVGLAYSKVIVSIIGTENCQMPKAFGECVYHATKLSKGYNKIYVNNALEFIWPEGPSPTIRFDEVKIEDYNYKAFQISRME